MDLSSMLGIKVQLEGVSGRRFEDDAALLHLHLFSGKEGGG
jgi:hypothetical protein